MDKQRRLRVLRRSVVSCWMVTTVAVLGTVAWAGMRIRSHVNDLLLPGQPRQQMMADLEHRIGHSVGPKIQAEAARAFRDLQPILLKDAQAVDAQAQPAAHAAVAALVKFRDDLPGVFSSSGRRATDARPYQDQVTEILDSLNRIRDQEAPNVRGVAPTWDMDLMVLEEMHREVASLTGVIAK